MKKLAKLLAAVALAAALEALAWGQGGSIQSLTPFSQISSGTNTIATMVCSTGCSITPSGSGVITATSSAAAAITDDTTTNATMFPVWVTANTGNLPLKVTSTKLTFNPSTGLLSTTSLAIGTGGNLTSAAAATLQLGLANVDTAAAAVAQILTCQGMLAGGTSNQAGVSCTIAGSQSKGTGVGGSLIFTTTPAGSAGTAVNAPVTALTITAIPGSSTTGVGPILIGNGGTNAPQLTFTPNSGTSISLGMENGGGAITMFNTAFARVWTMDGAAFKLRSDGGVYFSTGSNTNATVVAGLSLISSGVIGVGTGAQGSVAGEIRTTLGTYSGAVTIGTSSQSTYPFYLHVATNKNVIGQVSAGENLWVSVNDALNAFQPWGFSASAFTFTGTVNLPSITGATAGDIPMCWSTTFFVHTAAATCGVSLEEAKTDIQPLGGALAQLMRMQPIDFAWKDYVGYDGHRDIGFGARAMAAINPLFGAYERGDLKNFKDRAVLAVTVGAVQDQQAQIDQLRREIEALKAKF